ncbi:MAG: metallopeptidase family protein [Chloroflexota bacterium]
MHRARFEQLVAEAVEELPEEFQEGLDNIVVVVEQWPSHEQMVRFGLESRGDLLGLYEGVPLTEGARHQVPLPDRITIFQKPIERICRSEAEIKARVAETVRHEIAHYFGIGDERLDEIEREKGQ